MILDFLLVDISQDFPIATKYGDPSKLLNLIIPLLIVGMLVILIFMLFFAAITMMTAGGNPEAFKKAQRIFQTSVFGAIIVATSYLAVKVIAKMLDIDLPL